MKAVPLLFRITAVVVFLQLLLGGLLTFNYITPLIHIMMGLAVLVFAMAAMVATLVSEPALWRLRWISIVLVVLILIQGAFGFATLENGSRLLAWLHFVNSLAIYGMVVAGTFMATMLTRMSLEHPAPNAETAVRPNIKRPRPESVAILAVVEILTGVIFTFGGSFLLLSNPSGILLTFATFHIPIAASFLMVGAATLAAKRWAWLVGLAVAVISIVDDVVALAIVPLPFAGEIGTSVVLVTALIATYYLARSDIRLYLKSPHHSA